MVFAVERRTEVMGTGQQSSLRLEATESQASLLQQVLSELNKAADYQEEQHGSALFVCLRFQPAEEKAVRRILVDIGLRAAEDDEALSA
jgi:hypothetical protein